MPLRDHYRPPISKRVSWEGFHAMFAMTALQQISYLLPARYTPEPRADLGTYRLITEAQTEDETTGAEPLKEYAYEVLIFDQEEDRRLVAAIEFVSPANKDRPDSRRLFVDKCVGLLKHGVCVSIVDLVTIRQQNLYADLFIRLNGRRTEFEESLPPIYAATCRPAEARGKFRLAAWVFPLAVGRSLPIALPVWLSDDVCVPLDLEASYGEACRSLKIT